MSTQIKQFLKLTGVAPEAIPRLHDYIQKNGEWPAEIIKDAMIAPSTGRRGFDKINPRFMSIVESKFDEKHGTYTVEIAMDVAVQITYKGWGGTPSPNPVNENKDDRLLIPSTGRIMGIYTALDPRITL